MEKDDKALINDYQETLAALEVLRMHVIGQTRKIAKDKAKQYRETLEVIEIVCVRNSNTLRKLRDYEDVS